MSSKRYYEFTESERLALTPEETLAAVKIEAICRGIRPPAPITDMLENLTRTAGFQIPPDAIRVYEIAVRENSYGTPEPTGLCFKTEEEALNAAKGAYYVKRNYNSKGGDTWSLYSGDVTILTKFIGACTASQYTKPIAPCEDGGVSEEFEKLCEECRDDQARIRQEAYDKEVRRRKRAEYVQLAKGDLEVAAAFWRKVESGDFPSDEGGAA